jgi:diguanylate cyclase (GGDEF)-like protein
LVAVRTVTRPEQRRRRAAQLVAGGSYDVDLHPRGSDELAELTRSFDAMVRGLKEREEMKLLVSLSSTLDLPQVLHKLLDALHTLVPFEKASVLLMRTNGWEVALSRGYLDPDEPRVLCPVPGKDSLAARALREGKPALSAQSNTIVVPLPSREDETAALVCLERRHAFEPRTAQLAAAFLKPAAVALDNARLFSEVKRLATIDGLTGVANRRHFLELGHRLFETARRYGQPLSALMIDVDRFKMVNDQYGHATGDQVLRTVAERCRQCLRSPDLLGRYGGEEFAVLLPMTQQGPAQNTLAERIRRIVSLEPIPTDTGPVTVTLSIGVATVSPGIGSLEELLSKADAGLYEAKSGGRNRVA